MWMPEVVLVGQQVQHGVRHAADAELQRGPVGDQPGDVVGDRSVMSSGSPTTGHSSSGSSCSTR